MLQFFLSSWRSGFRGRGFLAVFLLGVVFVAIAYLSASFSPRQPRTVALDVGLSGLRFGLVLFAISLVQELLGKEIERRTVVLTLSYPISRAGYLLGRYFGILALTGVAGIILGMLLWIAIFLAGGVYDQQFAVALGWPYWITVAGVWVDVAVVAAFVVWISSLSTVPMLPMALGVIFAIAGKALGAMADYLAKGADGQAQLAADFGPLVDAIRYLLPDLSRLDWRVWPMYNQVPELALIGYALLMAVAYVVVMLGLAVHTFSRREFS